MNTAKAARERVMELAAAIDAASSELEFAVNCGSDSDCCKWSEALVKAKSELETYLSRILPDEEQLRCDGAGLARVGAVVLPERCEGSSFGDTYNDGWNACLDAIGPGPLYRRPVRGEPVAWMFPLRYGSGLSFVKPESYEDEETLEMVHPTPLYTAPPAISEPKDGERQRSCRVDAGARSCDSSEAVVPDEIVADMISAFWGSPVAGFDSMRAAIRVLDEYRSK